MILTENDIKSVLTSKGEQAVIDNKSLGDLIELNPENVGDKAFSTAYAIKIHKRKLKSYLQSLYQMNGQVNTLLLKMVHNHVLIKELIKADYLDGEKLSRLFPKLVAKLFVTENSAKNFEDIESFKELEEFYVIYYKDQMGVIKRDEFKKFVPDVISGGWEGGCDKLKLKEFRKNKQAKKQLFYTKSCKVDKKILAVCKITGDAFTVFPDTNFNHRKFSDAHRGMSFEEIKALVELKFHKEKDLGWFKQYETEVKA